MTKAPLPALGLDSFERLKKLNTHGAEYWSARGLQPLFGYAQWRRFEEAVARAKVSCEASGNKADYHFAAAGNMIETGKGAQREVEDVRLSHQNGDPEKAGGA